MITAPAGIVQLYEVLLGLGSVEKTDAVSDLQTIIGLIGQSVAAFKVIPDIVTTAPIASVIVTV